MKGKGSVTDTVKDSLPQTVGQMVGYFHKQRGMAGLGEEFGSHLELLIYLLLLGMVRRLLEMQS